MELNGDISQTPEVSVSVGKTARILCNHGFSTYNALFWYKQKQDTAPNFIISGYSASVEKGRFKMTIDKRSTSTELAINEVKTEDAGLYLKSIFESPHFTDDAICHMNTMKSDGSLIIGRQEDQNHREDCGWCVASSLTTYKTYRGAVIIILVTAKEDMKSLVIKIAAFLLALSTGISGQESVSQEDRFAFAKEGETIQLTCSYQGTANNLQWYNQTPDGQIHFMAILYSTKTESFGRFDMSLAKEKRTTSLLLKRIQLDDSVVYFCAMSHRIRGQDSVNQAKAMEIRKEGEIASFGCNYNTSNFYSLHWYRQYPGEGPTFLLMLILEEPESKGNLHADLDKKKRQSHLNIRGVQFTDAATYFFGHSQSQVTQTPAFKEVREGDLFTISCAYSNVLWTYFWYRQLPGKAPSLLLSIATAKNVTEKNFTAEYLEKEKQSLLHLSNSQLQDSGTYFCAVEAQWCRKQGAHSQNLR
ncbi:hypothetical protein JD844_001085 [Phrynosoma platyrhinos]|uniref:Ig-like domain-containing protein n=1 Tax=Phrynosoma platyrhinos TaxID=52577 RepID=A0ABQ7T9Z0_PHRPL|nr:hypothetical protein JD844_001085 [Phrynosoma platyrhinos]